MIYNVRIFVPSFYVHMAPRLPLSKPGMIQDMILSESLTTPQMAKDNLFFL